MNSNGRRPQNIKEEYLSNHLLDHSQILNLSLYDQTIFRKSFLKRQPTMEDNLEISKVEYLSNHLLDYTQIFNLDMGDQSKVFKYFNEDDIWKATSKD
jgi:hypothetical protein